MILIDSIVDTFCVYFLNEISETRINHRVPVTELNIVFYSECSFTQGGSYTGGFVLHSFTEMLAQRSCKFKIRIICIMVSRYQN